MGPNNLPIEAVPNCCKKKSIKMIPSTTQTICCSLLANTFNAGICRSPSMAEVMEMGGVIIPSANRAAPPIMAGSTNHFFCLRTNVYKLKMPPSPLLSACRVSHTYLIVVCSVSVQIIQESPPIMRSSDTTLSPTMAFKTYNGEVPISPYIIPSAISSPAADTLLMCLPTSFL